MNIYGMTFPATEAYFTECGENKSKAKMTYNALYRNAELTPKVSKMLRADFEFTGLGIIERHECPEAVKFLFGLHDGNVIEAVLMRHDYGNALCISTQVGCNMNCAFCRSGQNGKTRDLEAHEMVLQLLGTQEAVGEPVKRVTLMGIGEPLDNYNNVMDFIDIIGHKHGLAIAPRHITISTCGVECLDTLHPPSARFNIAISLHAPNDEIRNKIMPVNKSYNISRIINFTRNCEKKITFEYIMLDCINDSDDNARELAELVRGINCYVNLIPYNETGLGFRRSSDERIKSFYSILIQAGIRAVCRKEFGGDIKAACGQLKAERKT